jgi:hypothetical protein
MLPILPRPQRKDVNDYAEASPIIVDWNGTTLRRKKLEGRRLHSSTIGNNESSFKKSGRQIPEGDELKLAHRLRGPFNMTARTQLQLHHH